jgi:Txe/YoeB family toxin of Txe-Axe toxin-antitoxin module
MHVRLRSRHRSWRHRKRATAKETARRVDVIVGLMQRDEWQRTTSAEALAAEWRVAPATMEALASEASRRVVFISGLVTTPEKLQADVAGVLVRSLHAAYAKGSHADVARVGDIVTKIVGARAPDRGDADPLLDRPGPRAARRP